MGFLQFSITGSIVQSATENACFPILVEYPDALIP